MECPNHIFLLRPRPEVLDDLINDNCIFFIAFLEILFDLIRIRSFSHQAIGDSVDLIVALTCDLFCDVFDVVVIPVLLFIDVGKGGLESVQLTSLHY